MTDCLIISYSEPSRGRERQQFFNGQSKSGSGWGRFLHLNYIDFQGDIMLPNHLASIAKITREQGSVRRTPEGHFFESDIATYSAWKIPLLRSVLTGAPWAGKESTPWRPDSLHDFMHAKVVVADDVCFVGSFNLSRSGERNAENVVEVHDADLADRLASYVDEVRARYPAATPPGDPRTGTVARAGTGR